MPIDCAPWYKHILSNGQKRPHTYLFAQSPDFLEEPHCLCSKHAASYKDSDRDSLCSHTYIIGL